MLRALCARACFESHVVVDAHCVSVILCVYVPLPVAVTWTPTNSGGGMWVNTYFTNPQLYFSVPSADDVLITMTPGTGGVNSSFHARVFASGERLQLRHKQLAAEVGMGRVIVWSVDWFTSVILVVMCVCWSCFAHL